MMKGLTIIGLFLMGMFTMVSAQNPGLPLDFESTTVTYTWTDFGGGAASVIANPDMSGINTSGNVAQMVKNMDQTFGGSFIDLDGAIDFSTSKTFSVKVWAPRVGARMLLKVENSADQSQFFEKEMATTTASAWEELIFDYSLINTANPYDRIVIIFDNGDMGDGSANFTFYFDDIQLVAGGPVLDQIDLPVTFEDTANVDYTLVDFGGAASAVVTDPTDPNNIVARSTKTSGAELWAGTSMGAGYANPIPFTMAETKMSVKVWSPSAGLPIRLKVEDASNNTITCEIEDTTTVAMGWQIMEFDFNNPVMGTPALDVNQTYALASIFFNFGTTGAMSGADTTFYWDDVVFGTDTLVNLDQIDLTVTFDDPAVDYTLTDFGGNASMVIVDPTDASNMVAQSTKTASAELWSGTTIGTPAGFASVIPFTATETQMSVRVWSPSAGIPVRLKVEDETDGTISAETEVNTTVAMDWETLVFDLSNVVMGTPAFDANETYEKASIFFNFGKTGAEAGSDTTFYWDDVAFGDGSVGIEDLYELGLNYYPNPVQQNLTISAARNIEAVTVFNSVGQMLKQESTNAQRVELDLSDLAPGVYLLRTQIGEKVGTFRVIKE
ncbi:MAG: T9SS type A sorting domain-containing protein [Bacteroidota bacterium]